MTPRISLSLTAKVRNTCHGWTRGVCCVVLIVCILVTRASALPTPSTNRWDRPCAGSTTSTRDFPTNSDTATNVKKQYQIISQYAAALSFRVAKLQNRFVSSRFSNKGHVQALEKYVLMGLLSEALPRTFNNLVAKTSLTKAYERLSRVAVFLEETRLDEKDHEHNHGFASTVAELEEDNFTLLCKLQVAYRALKIQHQPSITRAIMEDKVRDIPDRAERHNRDYIVIRDFHRILNHIRLVFSFLTEQA